MRTILLCMIAAAVYTQSFAQVDRSKPPKAGPAPIIKIDNPVITKLTNGITVLVVENHKLPKISATYSIDMGPITEGDKAGVLSLMGGMLGEGTTVRSKAAFDQAVDKIGADVNLSAGGGFASALTRYFDSAFILMAEAIKKPSFENDAFEKLKGQTLTGLKANEKSVTAVAGRVTNALSYGLNHPAGEFETEESINNIALSDVKQAYGKFITPSRGYLTFVGDITPAKAQALAAMAFSTWKGAPLSLEKLTMVANPAKTEINLVDMPNAVQSEISVTNLISLPMSSADYFPVLVANQILGGGAESKLFMTLREKRGFTYGAYSSVGGGRNQTDFTASASVRNAKTDSAVLEFLNEIKSMRTNKVSDQELREVKAKYNGNFALGLENPARVAAFASDILINNLPQDFYRTYLQKINAVTADDVLRVANKYFNYDDTRIVVTGKAAEIEEGLKNLGFAVNKFDKFAKPVTEEANAAPVATVDAKTVIANYIKVIGGADELKKVTSYTVNMGMSMQGMTLDVQQKKMAPNMEMMEIKMGTNVVNKTMFDGTTGYEMQMGQKKEMTAEAIAEKKAQSSLFEQVDYLTNKYTIKTIGTEKVDGKPATKLLITLPNGKTQTEYYDVTSSLLLKVEKDEVTNGTSVSNTVEFGDYKKVGNVLFPYLQKVTISAGGQEQSFEMKVTEVKLNEGVTTADFK